MIKNPIYRLLFCVVILFTTTVSIAQNDSLEIHTVKGKEYYIHSIEKGQSLYFIHKKYAVPIEVLKKENPSVLDGLSIGEKVFIPVKRDAKIEVKADGNFINHEVKQQQTLYSIAKLYNVKQKEIVSVNPGVGEGLKEGQIIKIPVLKIKKGKNLPVADSKKTGVKYKTHKVVKGETLYSLSKLYTTSVDSIKLVNGGLKQGLKEGEIIYIPKVIENEVKVSSVVAEIGEKIEQLIEDTGVVAKKPEYSIGLLLPFYLDENDEMTENRSVLEKKSIYPKSKFAIEFYNGFKTAIDSISNDTCKFKIYVYDTKGNDSLRTRNLLLKKEMENLDLIVGPLYYNNFKQVAQFAQENRIPVVSPVNQSNKLLLGNQYVFKAIPSKSTILAPIAKLVVDSFKSENLIAIEYEKAKEKSLVDLYVKSYNNQILNSDDTIIYSPINVLQINSNMADIVSALKMDKNNVIFVPASDQTFVTNLFNYLAVTLNKKVYKDYKITIIGMEEWMKYENIDLEYFQKLNVHYCSTRFVDDKDSIVTGFMENYIETRKTYPSNNTLLGFDLAYYLGNNFINNGTLFSATSLNLYKGMSIDLNFFKTGIESGFENKSAFLLRFDDFTLKRID